MIYNHFLTDDNMSYYTVTKKNGLAFSDAELLEFDHIILVSRTRKTVIIEVKL